MKQRNSMHWLTIIFVVLIVFSATSRSYGQVAGQGDTLNKFETVRAYIDAWISKATPDDLLMSALQLKETVLDDWAHQRDKYQIVSVRNPKDYNDAGHIPNAINIYWGEIVADSNLAKLDSHKTQVLYCYFGQASMISSTMLSLLGYNCRSLEFGMMGWNLDALVKAPWDKEAAFAVDTAMEEPQGVYPAPLIGSDRTDTKSVILDMARKYLGGEGSPIMVSQDVKAIIDDWDQKKLEYQLVDVRSKGDYKTGHVPHAMSIPLASIAKTENLTRLDPKRIAIAYSENGQTGQLAATALNLLGYRAVAMKFGMMDWNKNHVDSSRQWHAAAGYPVERSPQGQSPK